MSPFDVTPFVSFSGDGFMYVGSDIVQELANGVWANLMKN